MKYIVLRFESPLMSFGDGYYWDIRGTVSFPTRSAVIGICALCLGYTRDDSAQIAELNNAVTITSREDSKVTTLRDYHTILDTLRSSGALNKDTVVSVRHYLADGGFTVLLGILDDSIFEELIKGLSDPVWPPFLGRKACISTTPIFQGEIVEADSAYEALDKTPLLAIISKKSTEQEQATSNGRYQCVTDERIGIGKKRLVRDVPVNTALRIFSQREVYTFSMGRPSCI
jgi:CRISPR-associated protein Cas5/CasD subtype I-E